MLSSIRSDAQKPRPGDQQEERACPRAWPCSSLPTHRHRGDLVWPQPQTFRRRLRPSSCVTPDPDLDYDPAGSSTTGRLTVLEGKTRLKCERSALTLPMRTFKGHAVQAVVGLTVAACATGSEGRLSAPGSSSATTGAPAVVNQELAYRTSLRNEGDKAIVVKTARFARATEGLTLLPSLLLQNGRPTTDDAIASRRTLQRLKPTTFPARLEPAARPDADATVFLRVRPTRPGRLTAGPFVVTYTSGGKNRLWRSDENLVVCATAQPDIKTCR